MDEDRKTKYLIRELIYTKDLLTTLKYISQNNKLIDESESNLFFRDIRILITESIIMRLSKFIIDSHQFGNNKNLTFDFLVSYLTKKQYTELSQKINVKLKELKNKLVNEYNFQNYRNKYLAHHEFDFDKLPNLELGNIKDLEKIFDDISELINMFSIKVFECEFSMNLVKINDIKSLLYLVRDAITYRRITKDRIGKLKLDGFVINRQEEQQYAPPLPII